MRKLLIVLVAMLMVSVFAVAQNGLSQLTVWKDVEGEWVTLSMTDPFAEARAYKSGAANGSCNKQNWTVDIETEVQVAQWINWQLDGTKWTWYVRKPGKYITDCISFYIQSNGEIVISFSGFESPTYAATFSHVKDTVDAWYGYGLGNLPEDIEEMVSAEQLNQARIFIPDSADLHGGISRKLWNMIQVVNCNSACNYIGRGTVTITLQRIKPWIDPATGGFNF
ncbi:MAG TPA: hypothetical protein PLD34_00910 [Pseudothermotoga sp.]|nr:hypothetical protein [Pseudothermotoga sp.]